MKNNPVTRRRVRRTYFNVSLVFFILALSLQVLLWLYWDKILEPRLRRDADSQASVLAHSQAFKLAGALSLNETDHHVRVLQETIDEILLFTDQGTKATFFKGISLEIDYEAISAPIGSLNLSLGQTICQNCFIAEVALFSPISDELIGIARFLVTDSLFQRLSKDVKRTLFSQSYLGFILLFIVWMAIMVLIREISRSRQQAEIASRAKSAFLANMSHELRTPLNAIIGFSQLMGHDSEFIPKHKKNLAIINRSGEYLLDLINDILELSRIEAGQNSAQESTFDLYNTLDKVAEMIRLRAETKNLHLNFIRMDHVPRYIRSDERKLRQILLNLLGNAVKFTEQGGVTLRVDLKKGDKTIAQNYLDLQFEVEDTGPGVSSEESAKMFEAFIQAKSGQNKQEGTGLGLAISRQFVNHLGGELKVDSVVGQGTIFRFTMRSKVGNSSEIEKRKPTRRVIGQKKEGREKEQPYRILVVDDHKENRALLSSLLEQVGFAIKSAANGVQAVELNETWQPHLIWMDIRMPLMDGYEATKQIRTQIHKNKEVPQPTIIALTASAFEEDRAAVLAAGCDDFVRRPFREADIFDKIHEFLGVDFIYAGQEEDSVALSTPHAGSIAEMRIAIDRLPGTIAKKLKTATELSDMEQIDQLVHEIHLINAPLAHELMNLVDTFQYDQILLLLDQSGEPTATIPGGEL